MHGASEKQFSRQRLLCKPHTSPPMDYIGQALCEMDCFSFRTLCSQSVPAPSLASCSAIKPHLFHRLSFNFEHPNHGRKMGLEHEACFPLCQPVLVIRMFTGVLLFRKCRRCAMDFPFSIPRISAAQSPALLIMNSFLLSHCLLILSAIEFSVL